MIKKAAPCEGVARGERRIWERMEKKWKDRKIGNSDFIDSVGYNLYPTHYIRKMQINWFLWGGRDYSSFRSSFMISCLIFSLVSPKIANRIYTQNGDIHHASITQPTSLRPRLRAIRAGMINHK